MNDISASPKRDETCSLRAVLDMRPAEIPSVPEATHKTDPERSKLVAAMMLDDPAVDLRTPYFNQSDLLKRGWSMRLIAQLLGGRDWEVPNPHGAGFAPYAVLAEGPRIRGRGHP